jgi:hypothetical protein
MTRTDADKTRNLTRGRKGAEQETTKYTKDTKEENNVEWLKWTFGE